MLRAMPDSQTGRLVWYELLTTDQDAAIAFYTDVARWTTQAYALGEGYTMWTASQGTLGGVSVLPEQAKQMGAQPYWQGNVIVADVDATIAKVKELGGQVYHAETVPGVGRLAVIADPQGAVLAIVAPEREMPAHDIARPGEVSWHELYTTNHEAAFTFYSTVFGWERLGAFDLGPMGTYLLWGRGGKQLGGMMTMPPQMKTPDDKPVPPSWMYYVTTTDLEGQLARAKSKGAKVINGPMDVPGGQRIVQMLDPQGAAFALVTPPKADPAAR